MDESRILPLPQTGYVTSGQILALCASVYPFVKQKGGLDSHKCPFQLWIQVSPFQLWIQVSATLLAPFTLSKSQMEGMQQVTQEDTELAFIAGGGG